MQDTAPTEWQLPLRQTSMVGPTVINEQVKHFRFELQHVNTGFPKCDAEDKRFWVGVDTVS